MLKSYNSKPHTWSVLDRSANSDGPAHLLSLTDSGEVEWSNGYHLGLHRGNTAVWILRSVFTFSEKVHLNSFTNLTLRIRNGYVRPNLLQNLKSQAKRLVYLHCSWVGDQVAWVAWVDHKRKPAVFYHIQRCKKIAYINIYTIVWIWKNWIQKKDLGRTT